MIPIPFTKQCSPRPDCNDVLLQADTHWPHALALYEQVQTNSILPPSSHHWNKGFISPPQAANLQYCTHKDESVIQRNWDKASSTLIKPRLNGAATICASHPRTSRTEDASHHAYFLGILSKLMDVKVTVDGILDIFLFYHSQFTMKNLPTQPWFQSGTKAVHPVCLPSPKHGISSSLTIVTVNTYLTVTIS